MTSRERVTRALRFDKPDRVPRDLWELPGAEICQPGSPAKVRERFPPDIERSPIDQPRLPHMKGQPWEVGTYIDEWGCSMVNIQRGVVGEVKDPVIKSWDDLEKVKPPYELVGKGLESVDDFCVSSDKFVLAGWANPFERLQFLRGSENLFMDLAEMPDELTELRDMVHEYFLAELETLCHTKVDGIVFADDWGTQRGLLVSPQLWREFFKPLYKDYVDMIHGAGKFVFMHSDGYIMEIYEHVIQLGVDAVNSQLFCMPIEQIGERFRGKITFWGELDRQDLMPRGSEDQVRAGVRRVWRNLSYNGGGVIAQFEYGLDTKLENALAAFDEWEKVN